MQVFTNYDVGGKVPQPPAATVLRGPRKPHWSCGQCSRTENWACRIQFPRGRDAPASIVARARQRHKEAVAGGGGGRRGGPKKPPAAASGGLPKELAAWMQAMEK